MEKRKEVVVGGVDYLKAYLLKIENVFFNICVRYYLTDECLKTEVINKLLRAVLMSLAKLEPKDTILETAEEFMTLVKNGADEIPDILFPVYAAIYAELICIIKFLSEDKFVNACNHAELLSENIHKLRFILEYDLV